MIGWGRNFLEMAYFYIFKITLWPQVIPRLLIFVVVLFFEKKKNREITGVDENTKYILK